MTGETVYLLCGVWALLMLAIFIQAIRLSYRIEARSPDLFIHDIHHRGQVHAMLSAPR